MFGRPCRQMISRKVYRIVAVCRLVPDSKMPAVRGLLSVSFDMFEQHKQENWTLQAQGCSVKVKVRNFRQT